MGGERTPGAEGLGVAHTSIDEGTLARAGMPSPGPIGSKGGGRGKEAVSLDPREQFRIWMREAGVSPVQPFPLGEPVEDYFRWLVQRQTPPPASDYDVMSKYTWYASRFYVHIAITTGNPAADVTWPGTEHSCNSWSEIQARPLNAGRRVIDCEGFAFIASSLFAAAGWTAEGFEIAYGGSVGQTSGFAYHIAARLTSPGGRTIGVGTGRALDRRARDEAREAMQPFGAMRMLPDVYTTQADAVQAVNQHAQQQGELTSLDEIRTR
jgi:hypothetical protein